MPEQMCSTAEGLGKERLLLVDDDHNLLESLRRLFKDDFDVFTAEGTQFGLIVGE